MLTTLSRIAPVLAGLAAGALLRQLGLAKRSDGEFLFKLVFYVTLPALSFLSLATVEITTAALAFPVLALGAVTAGFGAGLMTKRLVTLDPAQRAVFVITCMIVNSGFVLPFAQALYGSAGAARVAAFDAVNSALVFTWAYAVAARANSDHEGGNVLAGRLLRSPPLYAVACGVITNLAGWTLPSAVSNTTTAFGSATGLLITLAVGIVFAMGKGRFRPAVIAIGTRLLSGLAIAVAVIVVFDLHGMDRTMALLFGVAPVGFNGVTFASLEKLDVELAASILSLSLVVSLVLATAVVLTIG